jgi:hypothetical protein
MAEQASESRRRLEDRLIEKARQDEAFYRALRADPRAALGQELGGSIPEGITITVVEETPTSYYLVLPANPARRSEELSDAELESVAGGGGEFATQRLTECWPEGSC